tara:strand:- start:5584 stop:5940 length:357 start_codon:yes stop_codon:yes gene_type:complete
MANTFRVVTKSGVATDSSSPTTLYTTPASTTSIVLALLISNKHTTSIKATVVVSSDTTVTGAGSTNADAHIIKDVSIEEETSLEIMSGQKYVLATTDILQVYADNANLDVVFSFMEIT